MTDSRFMIAAALVCMSAAACKSRDNAASTDTTSSAAATQVPAGSTAAAGSAGSTGATGSDSMSKAGGTNGASNTATTKTDANLLALASAGDSAEVSIAKYMTTNTTDANVKAFATLLERDHGKGSGEVDAIARRLNIQMQLPSGDTTTQSAAHVIDRLKSLSGHDRDTAFVNHEIADHQRDIGEAKANESTAQSPDVKALFKKEQPELQKHLDRAQSLASKLGSAKSSK